MIKRLLTFLTTALMACSAMSQNPETDFFYTSQRTPEPFLFFVNSITPEGFKLGLDYSGR